MCSPAVRADEMPKEMEGIKGGGEYMEYGCRDMPSELRCLCEDQRLEWLVYLGCVA